ncbi:MAG: hypothetical protein OEZ41_07385, partial [Nitrospirota bacterium]|nr:hypothetical protein [Nitrospirota bacterium]
GSAVAHREESSMGAIDRGYHVSRGNDRSALLVKKRVDDRLAVLGFLLHRPQQVCIRDAGVLGGRLQKWVQRG